MRIAITFVLVVIVMGAIATVGAWAERGNRLPIGAQVGLAVLAFVALIVLARVVL